MIKFNATIKKFAQQGEKTGWTYIELPAAVAEKLQPGKKQSFRVKGSLDAFVIKGIALIPMGGGDFILPLNATIRKGVKKKLNEMIRVELAIDTDAYSLPVALMVCLADEPAAMEYFNSLTKGHRNYFGKWIESAKTIETSTKRIAMAVNALSKKMGYPEMIRAAKKAG
ncbi:MAG: YdeI/OmpD-associated family protein [Chitinophagaceae bacterium]